MVFRHAWLLVLLAALQLVGLEFPCAPERPTVPGPGHLTEIHAGDGHAGHGHAGHVPVLSHEGEADRGEPVEAMLTAACPCGCTGGSALATPARNLGDALFLELPALIASRETAPPVVQGLPAPPIWSKSIDHVPLPIA